MKASGLLGWTMASLGVSILAMGGLAIRDLSELATARRAVAEAEKTLAPRSAIAAVAAEVTDYKNKKNHLERNLGIASDLMQRQGEKLALFQTLETLPRQGVKIEEVWVKDSAIEIDARAASLPMMIGFAETVARTPGFSGVLPVRRRVAGEGPASDGRGLPFTLRARFTRPEGELP